MAFFENIFDFVSDFLSVYIKLYETFKPAVISAFILCLLMLITDYLRKKAEEDKHKKKANCHNIIQL
ncbi:hypothetical protein SAMN02745116_00355 [Pilibacter termitis]|uniref:Uncharacterized protein n=1 Tax=Pilibacter termitis TaxID=263852 RepID=A0A1T4KRU0_9ENTE|nr:hypothetical protein [Pilibacter termitis]SJZ45159.1 hypothetical protein SAMN02745116_00355 [Pilibacter termitis]